MGSGLEHTLVNLWYLMEILNLKEKRIPIGKIQLFQQFLKIQFSGGVTPTEQLWKNQALLFSKTLSVLTMDSLEWSSA